MSNEETVDTLVKAREVLWEKGWTQGKARNEKGEVCAFGAIDAAVFERCRVFSACAGFDALTAAEGALMAVIPCSPCPCGCGAAHKSIPEWNDAAGRTFAEIVDAFDAAIKSLESE